MSIYLPRIADTDLPAVRRLIPTLPVDWPSTTRDWVALYSTETVIWVPVPVTDLERFLVARGLPRNLNALLSFVEARGGA